MQCRLNLRRLKSLDLSLLQHTFERTVFCIQFQPVLGSLLTFGIASQVIKSMSQPIITLCPIGFEFHAKLGVPQGIFEVLFLSEGGTAVAPEHMVGGVVFKRVCEEHYGLIPFRLLERTVPARFFVGGRGFVC